MDFNNVKLEPHLKLNIGKFGRGQNGGDGGSVLIFAEKLVGDGNILANGGNGVEGGKGGNINIITTENRFDGEISVKGGDGR